MALVVESTSTATQNGTIGGPTNCVITAPTGIQTGDLLVIIATGTGVNTFTSTGFTSSFSELNLRVLYKYAVLADESTANYTVSTTANSGMVCSMYRISGYTTGNPVFFEETFSGSVSGPLSPSRTVSTIRPTQQINFIVSVVAHDDPRVSDFNSPSISSSDPNPTWTKLLPTLSGGVNALRGGGGVAVASCFFYATSSDTSDVTEYSYTIAGASEFYDNLTDAYFTIHQPQNINADISPLAIPPTVESIVGSNTANATIDHLTIAPTIKNISAKISSDATTRWTNEARPTTNWTNEQKL